MKGLYGIVRWVACSSCSMGRKASSRCIHSYKFICSHLLFPLARIPFLPATKNPTIVIARFFFKDTNYKSHSPPPTMPIINHPKQPSTSPRTHPSTPPALAHSASPAPPRSALGDLAFSFSVSALTQLGPGCRCRRKTRPRKRARILAFPRGRTR